MGQVLLIPLITALVSAFLIKQKKIMWPIFLVSNGFVLYRLFTLYGQWDLSITMNTHLSVFGTEIILELANHPLGWFFAFFSAVVTLIISIFSLAFHKNSDGNAGPIWLLILFSNLGIFFAYDWITFFAMWELMGWTSFFAITNGREKALDGAKYYLALSLLGASSMLFGILLIGKLTGTFNILASGGALLNIYNSHGAQVITVLVLLFFAFIIKSALFPFYMWPAKVYSEGPEDYISFMSSVMIKYGVYPVALFIVPMAAGLQLEPILGNSNWVQYSIGSIGAVSAVLGTLLAIFQTDMKKLFAYSSVANLGYIFLGFASMNLIGYEGALLHTVNHMIFKGAIFLTLAAVVFRTNESQMHKLGGLVYRMPITFLTFLFGIIAAAGIPPLNGFGSKWMILQALMNQKLSIFAIAMIFASAGSFMYLFRALSSIFLGQLPERYKDVKEVPWAMRIPMLLLMMIMLLAGTVPGVIMKPLTAVLMAMGYRVEIADWSTLKGSMLNSDINLTLVFGVFLVAFVIVFILYMIGNKSAMVPQEDNYTAGEYPEDWGVTPDRFNYSYSFYQPFKEMFDPFLERISFDRFYEMIGKNFAYVSETIRGVYKKGDAAVLLFSIGLLLFILGGWII